MVTEAEWLTQTRDLGAIPRTISDPLLLQIATDAANDLTRQYDIWFLKTSSTFILTAPSNDKGWPDGLSRPESVHYFSGGNRVILSFMRREKWETTYQRTGYVTGPPTDYRLFGPYVQVGPTPTEDTTIHVTGYYYDSDLELWFTHAPDVLKYAALAGSEAAGFNDERIPLWKMVAESKARALIREGGRQEQLITAGTVRGDWRTSGG